MPLFVDRGYDAVTIDEIAAAADISRRTFFRLFGGKDQIVSCDHEVPSHQRSGAVPDGSGYHPAGGVSLIATPGSAAQVDRCQRR